MEKKISERLEQRFSIEEFITRLLSVRESAQLFHWKVEGKSSFSKHKASEDLYKSLIKKVDTFVESYQGKYGIIKGITVKPSNNDFTTYLQVECIYMETCNGKFKESWLNNQVDDITTLMYSTLYKLKILE